MRKGSELLLAAGQTGLSGPLMRCAGAAAVDALAAEAAERALALRGDAEKGARARKKKALTDLLKALGAAGVSRRRSAVPAAQRGVQAWFQQASVGWRVGAGWVGAGLGLPSGGLQQQVCCREGLFASLAWPRAASWLASARPLCDLGGGSIEVSMNWSVSSGQNHIPCMAALRAGWHGRHTAAGGRARGRRGSQPCAAGGGRGGVGQGGCLLLPHHGAPAAALGGAHCGAVHAVHAVHAVTGSGLDACRWSCPWSCSSGLARASLSCQSRVACL